MREALLIDIKIAAIVLEPPPRRNLMIGVKPSLAFRAREFSC